MKNTQSKIIVGLLVFVAVAVLIGIFMQRSPDTDVQNSSNGTTTPLYSGDTANLVSVSLVPGQTVSGMLTVTGSIKGAYFFEANAVGQVLDANKNVLKSFPLTATSDWMTAEPVSFSGTVDLSGVTAGKGYIRIHNDNPSGEPAHDRFIDIPVVFQ